MKQGESEVRSKGKVLEQKAIFNVYDTVDEAVQSEGMADILSKINAQTRTNALNAVREGAQDRVTKKALENRAIAAIPAEVWGQIAGKPDEIRKTIDAKIAELEAEMDAAKNAETVGSNA